jgi:hypothetical protein
MSSDHSDETTNLESLAPKVLTERLNDLEPGDELTVNNHERTYEVVDTDTYSVVAEGPDGHRVTFSQNLQTGGWTFTEEIAYVETME